MRMSKVYNRRYTKNIQILEGIVRLDIVAEFMRRSRLAAVIHTVKDKQTRPISRRNFIAYHSPQKPSGLLELFHTKCILRADFQYLFTCEKIIWRIPPEKCRT